MELQSAQYLFDLAKQVEHYQLYLKKLSKYVHQQRLQVERSGEQPIKRLKRTGHSDKSVQSVLLHHEIHMERLEEREIELEDRIADLEENNRYLEERLTELQGEHNLPQQHSPTTLLRYKEVTQRHLTE